MIRPLHSSRPHRWLLILLITITQLASAKTFTYTFGGTTLTYETIDPYTCAVSSNTSVSGDVIIPSQVTSDGITYTVTSISSKAFYINQRLTSISIPASVTSIGDYAFNRCTAVKYISLPNTLTKIGSNAFRRCTNLTSISIPSSLTSISDGVFEDCSSLTSLTIPASVTSIGDYAFAGCTGITSFSIPGSLSSISGGMFSGCTGLTSIVLPPSITSIGSVAFSNCTGITSISIPASVKEIGLEAFKECTSLTKVEFVSLEALCDIHFANWGSNPLHRGGHLYVNGREITDLSIPSTLTSIPGYAFDGCKYLTSVKIPSSVAFIGTDAFKDCTSLTKAEFTSIEALCKISFNSLTSNPLHQGAHLYVNGREITDLSIPSTVTSIPGYAFYGYKHLTSVKIPASVTSIGQAAFLILSSEGLEKAEFESIEALCNIDFEDANSNPLPYARNLYIDGKEITDLTIPESITSIKKNTFFGCPITSVSIPPTVTSIDNYAFGACYLLKSLVLPESVTTIGREVFSYCNGLTSVTIPASVTSIGYHAFCDCPELTTIIYNTDNPREMRDDVFTAKNYASATLYTDCPADKLATVCPWNGFLSVKTMDQLPNLSGLDLTPADPTAAEPIEIYTLSGIKVPTDALTPGIYIERRSTHTRKIVIR